MITGSQRAGADFEVEKTPHPPDLFSFAVSGEGARRDLAVPAGGGAVLQRQRDPATARERPETPVHLTGSPGLLGQSDRRAGAAAGV